ncbi:hypothetical protein V8C86DRAFT_733989 [Haematococcus lacustris]
MLGLDLQSLREELAAATQERQSLLTSAAALGLESSSRANVTGAVSTAAKPVAAGAAAGARLASAQPATGLRKLSWGASKKASPDLPNAQATLPSGLVHAAQHGNASHTQYTAYLTHTHPGGLEVTGKNANDANDAYTQSTSAQADPHTHGQGGDSCSAARGGQGGGSYSAAGAAPSQPPLVPPAPDTRHLAPSASLHQPPAPTASPDAAGQLYSAPSSCTGPIRAHPALHSPVGAARSHHTDLEQAQGEQLGRVGARGQGLMLDTAAGFVPYAPAGVLPGTGLGAEPESGFGIRLGSGAGLGTGLGSGPASEPQCSSPRPLSASLPPHRPQQQQPAASGGSGPGQPLAPASPVACSTAQPLPAHTQQREVLRQVLGIMLGVSGPRLDSYRLDAQSVADLASQRAAAASEAGRAAGFEAGLRQGREEGGRGLREAQERGARQLAAAQAAAQQEVQQLSAALEAARREVEAAGRDKRELLARLGQGKRETKAVEQKLQCRSCRRGWTAWASRQPATSGPLQWPAGNARCWRSG